MKIIILIIIFIKLFMFNILENHLVTLLKQENNKLNKNILINFQLNYLTNPYDIKIRIDFGNLNSNYEPNFICNPIHFNGKIKGIKIKNYKKKICSYNLKNINFNSYLRIDYFYKNKLRESFNLSSNLNENTKIALFGDHDLSIYGMKTINYLKKFKYDLIFHLGDMAYDVYDKNFKKGDEYFKEMKNIMSNNIFLFTPGNHEYFNHTFSLNHKFQMPYDINNWKYIKGFEKNNFKNIYNNNFGNNLYTFTINSTFFISVNWDILRKEFNIEFIYNWIKIEIEKIKNNDEIKFKIFLSHRPFFCSKIDEFFECYRNIFYFKPIYDLLYLYKFDLVITAHVHFFEVTKKINNKFLIDKNDGIYYYIIGSGGTERKFGKIKKYNMFYIEKDEIFKVGILKLILNNLKIEVIYELINNKLLNSNDYQIIIDKNIYSKKYFLISLFLIFLFLILIIIYLIYEYKCKKRENIIYKNYSI